jgi:hypothetical protein
MSATNLQQRLDDLLNDIRQGKVIEAMNEFYDTGTVMQDMPTRRREAWRPTSSGKSNS